MTTCPCCGGNGPFDTVNAERMACGACGEVFTPEPAETQAQEKVGSARD